jgi:hypothetical protein
MEKTDLQKAIEVLENAGFHVDRAYWENKRDAGNPSTGSYCYQESLTGAICLRVTPDRFFEPLVPSTEAKKRPLGKVNDVY